MKIKVSKPKYKICMIYFEKKLSYALFIRNDRPDDLTLKSRMFPALRKWRFINSFKSSDELKIFLESRGYQE